MNLRKEILAKRKRLVLSPRSALSTGSTLLNLAMTDLEDCGFVKGCYYYLVGDSTSGKTWLSLTCFAEAMLNKHFSGYDLIFDDIEGGAMMNIEKFFGKKVAERMQAPSYYPSGEPKNSATIQDFYYHLRDRIKRGRPFIYVADSQDAMDSIASQKKLEEQKKASEEGTQAKGSYGDGKAKFHSENIRWVISGLRRTESILLIIGQTRDNLGFGFEPKTVSGGKSLRFYANTQIWTSVGKKIKKKVRNLERTVGIYCLAEIRKNRITGKIGKDRSAAIPVHYGYGMDDIGSCVDYLTATGHWTRSKANGIKQVKAVDLKFTGTRREVIKYIESSNQESQVRQIVGTVWRAIESECELADRKRRYD